MTDVNIVVTESPIEVAVAVTESPVSVNISAAGTIETVDITVSQTPIQVAVAVTETPVEVAITVSQGIETETDPIYSASVASTITAIDVAYWDAKQNALTAGVDYLTPGAIAAAYQPIGAYITDAPADSTTYGRNNNAWVAVTSGSIDHASLSNLDYANSGHSGFQASLGFTPPPDSRTISTTTPLSGGGDLSANRTLSITQAGAASDGYLSSTDWNTFNNKQATISLPLAASEGGTGVANGALATLTLPNFPVTIAGGVTGGVYTLPATSQTLAGLAVTGQTFTTGQKINVNSTTAFVVEQDGVNDNTLVVDTTTTDGRVAIGTAPALQMLNVYRNAIFNTYSYYRILLGTAPGYANDPGIWFGNAATNPTIFNFSFLGTDTYLIFNSPANSTIYFGINNAYKMRIFKGGGRCNREYIRWTIWYRAVCG